MVEPICDQSADLKAIRKILDTVVQSVHKLNYEGVREFFPDDGFYFGSYTPIARGYEEMVERQFAMVWPNISDFKIPADTITIQVSGAIAWATCQFESAATGPGGKSIERKGRMTFVFERRAGKWVIVHSHDSLDPTPHGE